MRSHGDLTGLIKFLARDDWKSSFEEVMGEHFGPAMQAFDLEYEAIGAALGSSWHMTLWGVAFEDFLGRQFEPDGRSGRLIELRDRGALAKALGVRNRFDVHGCFARGVESKTPIIKGRGTAGERQEPTPQKTGAFSYLPL